MSTKRYTLGYSIPNDDDYALVKLGPALDEAETMNVDVVELPLYALDVVARGRVIPERLKKVKAITEGRSIGYTIHGPLGLNLMEQPDLLQIHKDVLKATLDVALELGGRHYVAHSGGIPAASADPGPRFERQRAILAEMGDVAAASGIFIAVENLFGSRDQAMLPSRLAKELAAIGHPSVGACLDFSHAYLLATRNDVNFVEEAAALAPWSKHLHMHDSFGILSEGPSSGYRAERLAYGLGDLHLPIGLGSLPWDEIFRTCEFPADPVFIIELAPPYWTDLREVIANTRKLAETARITVAPGV